MYDYTRIVCSYQICGSGGRAYNQVGVSRACFVCKLVPDLELIHETIRLFFTNVSHFEYKLGV